MKKYIVALSAAVIAVYSSAQTPWLHIYHNNTTEKKVEVLQPWGETTYQTETYGVFETYPYSDIDSITYTGIPGGTQRMYIHYRKDGKATKKLVSLVNIDHVEVGVGVPTLYITTTDPKFEDVPDKDTYLDATLEIDGMGIYEDFSGNVLIRGRGNSTWGKDKKPYRLKLPAKTKLLGYRKAKNYVLLANRIDYSFMRNEVACLATQYSGADFPTHATPVNVYFNGIFKGSYMLIEKVGINNGSVNMPKEQEAMTCMFQFDVGYDEEMKVTTPIFNLPLMHKDPDLPEDPMAAQEWFKKWCEDFYLMESAVASGSNIGDYVDYTSLAKYIFVYNLTCNQEINHPKSIYMYKTEGGKWKFGPAWDFDWAFGYNPTYRTEAGGLSQADLERMFEEATAVAKEQCPIGYGWVSYNGIQLLWNGYTFYQSVDGKFVVWPYDAVVNYGPSYENYLLGCGNNNSGEDKQLGNGGEFFLSMIMDNPEFMAEYEKVWAEFSGHINEFWADFEAYAKTVAPSAANDAVVWKRTSDAGFVSDSEFKEMSDYTYAGAIKQLRAWVEKRLEFIGKREKNYGLYDPQTTYIRGSVHYK